MRSLVPLYLHVFGEIVGEGAVGIAVAGGEEAADDAADVFLEAEELGIVDAVALYPETEPADAIEHDGVSVGEAVAHHVLQLGDDGDDIALSQGAVARCLLGEVVQVYIALTDGLGEVLAVATATLDIVADEPDMNCHTLSTIIF